MRASILLVLLACAVPAQAQSPFPVFIDLAAMEPLHESTLLAYGVSIGSTAARVGLGYALYSTLPSDDTFREGPPPNHIGLVVMCSGALIGPMLGNLSLGAFEDARRGFIIKGIGMMAGGTLVLAILPAAAASLALRQEGCGPCDFFLYSGIAVMAAGLAGGLAYDLATIPRNARRAAERRGGRDGVTVSLAPATGATGLGLRVSF